MLKLSPTREQLFILNERFQSLINKSCELNQFLHEIISVNYMVILSFRIQNHEKGLTCLVVMYLHRVWGVRYMACKIQLSNQRQQNFDCISCNFYPQKCRKTIFYSTIKTSCRHNSIINAKSKFVQIFNSEKKNISSNFFI